MINDIIYYQIVIITACLTSLHLDSEFSG